MAASLTRLVATLFAGTVLATSELLLSPTVHAAGCAAGFQDAGGGVCTATFVLTGAPVSVVLPPDVSVVSAVVSGAAGGTSLEEQVDPFGGAASPGGKGGRETAVVPVPSGATLTVVVGEAGTGGMLAPPGYGGYGGGGHASSRYGGNGGGGSFVFDETDPLNVVVVVAAGGGGGGGYDYNPVVLGHGDQQAPGGDGSGASPAMDGVAVPFCCNGTAPYTAGGGGGATPDAGGAGGHPTLPPSYAFGQADGDPGFGPAIDSANFGIGGSTHNGCCSYAGWAGGGGGGYYGGGGGGNIEANLEGGGGGGGAGYVVPSAVSSSSQTGVQANDGEVTLSYFTGACHVSCATCSGPTATECASCPAGSALVNGACIAGPTTTTTTTTTTITGSTAPGTTTTTTTTTLASTTTTTTPAPGLCGPAPASGCRVARVASSTVKIKNDAVATKDALVWKWAKGDATPVDAFKNPVTGSAAYEVCVYDASTVPQPLMRMPVVVPPGGRRGKAACWKSTKKGFAYKNAAATPAGVVRVTLKSGIAGKAVVVVKGKGANLPMPGLPFVLPVTVELVIDDGATTECWQTVYTTATRNEAAIVRAKGP